MYIEIREYLHSDNKAVTDIWNQVVEDGNAFPQEKPLSYGRLGFAKIGTVPDGFRMPDGSYQDIILFYHAE